MRLLILASIALLSVVTVSSGSLIVVSPGPGTPLQDAIDAATPGDKLLLHAGDYLETVVITKRLRIGADGDVRIGPKLGPIQSSCTPAFVVDIAAESVRIDGANATQSTGYITIQGGGQAAVRLRDGARVRFRKVHGVSFCPNAAGIDVADVRSATLTKGSFSSYSSTAVGAPGCRIRQPNGKVSLKEILCDGGRLGPVNGWNAGPGVLVESTSPATPTRPVTLARCNMLSCGSAAASMVGAHGVKIQRSSLSACPLVLGEPPYYAVMLDAASSGNLVGRSHLSGPTLDAGTGNCFRGNVDQDGTPLPDVCS